MNATAARRLPLLLGCALLAGCAGPKASAPRAAPPVLTVAAANRLVDDVYAAWNTLDATNARPFYTDDPDAVFVDVAPPAMGFAGWPAFGDAMQANMDRGLTSMELKRSGDAVVEQRGSVAWAVFPYRVTLVLKDDRRVESDGRHTVVWERRADRWVIAHEHPSAPSAE